MDQLREDENVISLILMTQQQHWNIRNAWIGLVYGRRVAISSPVRYTEVKATWWLTAHHLKLNPSKTELLFIPSTTGPHCDLAISLWNSLIAPTEDARSLGVILDGQLSFSAHIANLTRSCRFLLYNIRPFLSQEATQLLVQSLVISRLDYCNSLLAGLPLRAIRPLQLVQNAAARLIFNLPKFTHVTPLLRSLHWLPVAARIRFKTLMLAYKAKNGPAPPYLMAMVKSRAVLEARRARGTSTGPLFGQCLSSWAADWHAISEGFGLRSTHDHSVPTVTPLNPPACPQTHSAFLDQSSPRLWSHNTLGISATGSGVAEAPSRVITRSDKYRTSPQLLKPEELTDSRCTAHSHGLSQAGLLHCLLSKASQVCQCVSHFHFHELPRTKEFYGMTS
ncbi:hypothetical protein NFI96_003558 [Prochilodus magdalenae]|nr:hypothetical protein NFI96_003558 [Prochilodus magdalenae]